MPLRWWWWFSCWFQEESRPFFFISPVYQLLKCHRVKFTVIVVQSSVIKNLQWEWKKRNDTRAETVGETWTRRLGFSNEIRKYVEKVKRLLLHFLLENHSAHSCISEAAECVCSSCRGTASFVTSEHPKQSRLMFISSLMWHLSGEDRCDSVGCNQRGALSVIWGNKSSVSPPHGHFSLSEINPRSVTKSQVSSPYDTYTYTILFFLMFVVFNV